MVRQQAFLASLKVSGSYLASPKQGMKMFNYEARCVHTAEQLLLQSLRTCFIRAIRVALGIIEQLMSVAEVLL